MSASSWQEQFKIAKGMSQEENRLDILAVHLINDKGGQKIDTIIKTGTSRL